jgi:hypothetical protein
MIDTELPGRPPFRCQEVVIGNEQLQFHFRDILQCIWALYGNPEFVQDLHFAPERHYVDEEQTQRIYGDMYTGDWWWSVQVRNGTSNIPSTHKLNPGVTRVTATRCYNNTYHFILRQNAANALWWEDGISRLYYYREHPKEDPSQAVMPRPTSHWIHPNNKA